MSDTTDRVGRWDLAHYAGCEPQPTLRDLEALLWDAVLAAQGLAALPVGEGLGDG